MSGLMLGDIPVDRGCHFHDKCLSCPFPACLIEAGDRERAIRILHTQGKTAQDLVSMGLDRGTVERALAVSA